MLTEADYNGWRFVMDAVHFNGGKEWFGWGHRCVDQPRLLVIDKYFRADRSTKRSFVVDGAVACETLAEALAALGAPVAVSDEERAALGTVSAEWSRPANRLGLVLLSDKGLVEWGRDVDNRVTARLTPAGISALEPKAK